MTTSSRLLLALLLLNTSSVFAQELPIKPSRTISFTTDEGSYMDLAISPDNKTILFDLLGDLYSIPAAGGQAKQLTRGLALNFRPVWSPDGSKIAYLSDYSGSLHLNVRDMSGKYHSVLGSDDAEVSAYASPVWTPDGNFISVGDSILYSLSGGKSSLYAGLKNIIGFSRDGLLAYYYKAGRLYRYDLGAKTAIQLLPSVKKRFQAPVLSPDGHWLAYITDSNSQLCLAVNDLQNNIQRILVPTLYIKHPHYPTFYYPKYSFTSDSKMLVIAYGGKIHRIEVQSGVNQIVPFYANINADLGPYDYHYFAVTHDSSKIKYVRSANVSPDGKRLIFSALDKIYMMELPHGIPHEVAPQSIAQFQPVFSPDGQWIAYVSWCDTTGGSLWRVPTVGGKPERLTNIPGQYQRPVWSPDGTLIAVVKGAPTLGDRDDPGIGQLELISSKETVARIIDDSVPLWNQLAFSPDGKKISYEPSLTSRVENPPTLIRKNLDGTDSTILSFVTQPPGFFSSNFNLQRTISPDNRFIVYSMGEDLYLTPMCKLAQPVEIYSAKKNLPVIKFAQGVDPFWEKGGKILSWTYGNKFYEIEPDKVLRAAQEKHTHSHIDGNIFAVNIDPKRVVALNIAVPCSYAHGVIALTNVRILTMQGSSIIDHGTLLIKDGRFTAVAPSNKVTIPRDAKIIDLSGTTIIPGLVDLHLHMRLPPDVFPQQSWMYLVNLAYGVTTARDPSSSFDSFGYGELLRSGQMLGPRLYTVGRAVRLFTEGINHVDNLQDARLIVNKRAVMGATTIKQYILPTRIQRQWLIIASNEARLDMTNEGDYTPLFDLAMIKDGSTGIEHNPLWADAGKDVTYFIAHSGTFLTPTLQVRYGEELTRYNANHLYWNTEDPKLSRFTPKKNLMIISNSQIQDTTNTCFLCPSQVDADIRHAGGRVTLGSHGEDQGIGAHNELWALQMGGMTNMEALQCATIRGAEALGVQKDLGSIEVGKIADLIILNKNPLDDIHNSREIRYVMKDGILYDGDTLDEIWPEQKKCPDWRLHEPQKDTSTDVHN